MEFDSYMNALSAFYNEAAHWKFESATGEVSKSRIKTLKKKAKTLEQEYKKLPPEMQRPQVAEHIQKALSLKDS